MRNRRTLKELAQDLELSIATVSRALGGYSDISEKTRERVRKRARELGYVPNIAGRMLVSGRSGFVGLVLPIRGPNFVDSFLGEFITGLGEGLVEKGSDLLIATAPPGQSELGVLENLVNSGRVDGVVLTRIAEKDKRLEFLMERNFPFVAHGRSLGRGDHNSNWLDTDGKAAFAQAFEMLYQLGHRRFGLVSIAERMSFMIDREAGLQQAKHNLQDPDLSLEIIRSPRLDSKQHRENIRNLLNRADHPTALFGLFDELALIAMQEAAALGLSIPQDLSVVGFDNVPAAAFSSPGLTTFDQKTRESAREIASLLHQAINGRLCEEGHILKQPELIKRGTHGPAPAN